MIELFARGIQPLLELPIIRRIRRNHALEHATAHMLAKRIPSLKVSGRAGDSGFFLVCNVPQHVMEEATHEALERLRKGEEKWAIHPNCGTNLVAAAGLSTLAAVMGLGNRQRITGDGISRTMLLMMLAGMFSQPFGSLLQKHLTTKADPGDLEILSITPQEIRMDWMNRKVTYYRVNTRRG
jgi:hypothetical protein